MTGTPAAADRPLAILVLAAGQGTRLTTHADAPPKVLVECLGVPLLEHVRRALLPLGATHTVVVTGHQAARVDAWLATHWPDAVPVLQEPQNGTGHAARLALAAIPDFVGDVLVVYGDVPQLRTAELDVLLDMHQSEGARVSLLSGVSEDPGSLGRVVRDELGRFVSIVEARDALDRPDILEIPEFNTGIYVFDADTMRRAVEGLSTSNAQGEEYLTDAVARVADADAPVACIALADADALLGVNDLADLAGATSLIRRRIVNEHLANGVVVVDPDTTVIEVGVEIAPGARILPFTYIQTGCRIGPGAAVGPFARLRGAAVLDAGAEIGNFVEVKNSTIGEGAKAKHLTYLGDAIVGPRANIGCGTVTANYDGVRKHETHIGADARIGSGTILVAPVRVGDGALTGANAVILAGHDVPSGARAVGVPARVLPKEGDDASKSADPESAGAAAEEASE